MEDGKEREEEADLPRAQEALLLPEVNKKLNYQVKCARQVILRLWKHLLPSARREYYEFPSAWAPKRMPAWTPGGQGEGWGQGAHSAGEGQGFKARSGLGVAGADHICFCRRSCKQSSLEAQ